MTGRSPTQTLPLGLSSHDVEQRRADGSVNVVPDRTSRTYADIIRGNLFTRFNAIIAVLGGVIAVVGDPVDGLFILVMLVNLFIGIAQETRAKRTLDRLTVLIAPTIVAVRDGREAEVRPSSLVIDDVIRLRPGDQVPVDAVVISADGLEVDESALTGESDPVPKTDGQEVLSGSAVLAGSACVRAIRVGTDAWIHRLVSQAKEYVLTTSELRSGVDRILRMVTWLIAPLSVLLLWSQLRADDSASDALVSAVAGVVGLVPQGLVLLVSMAMAVAIVRLARDHVVVQELHAVEGLARIDTLCVDKTGTLTTGHFELEEVIVCSPDSGPESLDVALSALVAAETSPTASTRVLAAALPASPSWGVITHQPFSSARKWSGTTFVGHGTWLLGAPDVLLDATCDSHDAVRRRVAELTKRAKRVLLVAWSAEQLEPVSVEVARDGMALPTRLEPIGLVVLSEQLRPDAAAIVDYFVRQHVTLKIISGDSTATVAAVADRLGVPEANHAVDLRHVDPDDYDDVSEHATVFGRVQPEQKRALVASLQRQGHNVAMTGDGVNDIPALKLADIGIAMDTATSATKSVAQLVLLDGRFDRLPNVVAEGRRVVANMERVSSLFVTKTVYAAVFALAVGVSGSLFPFLPRHMSLVSTFTIGVPAFLLSFRHADRPCRPGYLRRVVNFALPAGLAVAAMTLATYWFAQSAAVSASLDEARTLATLALTTAAFWVLYRLIIPADRYDIVLLIGLAAGFAGMVGFPPTRDVLALDWPPVIGFGATAAIVFGSLLALQAGLRWIDLPDWAWTKPPTRAEERTAALNPQK